jgi:hypothetical protein
MLLLVIRIDLPKGENLRNKNLKVDGGRTGMKIALEYSILSSTSKLGEY